MTGQFAPEYEKPPRARRDAVWDAVCARMELFEDARAFCQAREHEFKGM